MAALAKYVLAHFLKEKEQGVQIDLRTVPPTLTVVPHVPSGTVIIINQRGEAAVDKVAYDEPEKLEALLSPFLAKE